MQANKITGTAVSIRRYASEIGELSYSLRCFARGYNRVQTGSSYVPTRKCGADPTGYRFAAAMARMRH